MAEGGTSVFTDPRFPLGPVVRRGRNPLEVSLLAVFLVSAISGLINPAATSPLLARIFGEHVWIWNLGMIAGSVFTLVGVLFLKPMNDVLVERVGMIWLATCFLAYGSASAAISFTATYTGVILGLGVAFAARAWQITSDIRRLHKILKDRQPGEGGGC